MGAALAHNGRQAPPDPREARSHADGPWQGHGWLQQPAPFGLPQEHRIPSVRPPYAGSPLSAASSSAASPWLSRLSRGSCPSKYTRLGGCRILARLRLEEAYNHEGVRAGRDVISAEGVLLGITHGPGGPDTEAIDACGFGRRDHVA